jgi:hypothetical protein
LDGTGGFIAQFRQTYRMQTATLAMLADGGLGRVLALKKRMHRGNGGVQFCPERGGYFDDFAAPRFAVNHRPDGDFGLQHFFETDRLSAELQPVAIINFRVTFFVFDGIRQIASGIIFERDTVRRLVKFDDIALSRDAENWGNYF